MPNLTKTDAPAKCVSGLRREAYFLENVFKTIGASNTFQLRSLVESRDWIEIMLPSNGISNICDFNEKMQLRCLLCKFV